jgi:uncharacterized protein
MEFDNSFTVNAPLQRVWEFLLNVQEVAPCMPGAQLTEVVSDSEYKGTVKIKLGAVQMSYQGTVTISEIDEGTHTVVLVASGRETRGTGNASSTTTSHLVADSPDRTTVTLHSEVNVSGRVAQFGRGIMQDVASRIIGEFSRNLEARVTRDDEPVVEHEVEALAGQETPAAAETHSAVESSPQVESPAAAAPPAYRPPAPAPEAQAIKVLPILAAVTRAQVARGLRALASLIEPK